MMNSLLYFCNDTKNSSFQNSKILKGSWCVVVLDALKENGYNISDIRLETNTRKLKGCRHSEILFYKNRRVMTLKLGGGLSANDIIKQFKVKGL